MEDDTVSFVVLGDLEDLEVDAVVEQYPNVSLVSTVSEADAVLIGNEEDIEAWIAESESYTFDTNDGFDVFLNDILHRIRTR